MKQSILRLALLLGTALPALSAHASLTFSTAADAPIAGAHDVNFDDTTYFNPVDNGVTLAFTPNSGMNFGAQPYITNGSGTLFGDSTASGLDATPFPCAGSPITLTLPGEEHYFGILWGSVDPQNVLSFYAADNTLVGQLTGAQVAPNANGSWGADGTVYLNVASTLAFTTVVIDSGGGIFEFDNVAYDTRLPSLAAVPEAAGAAMLLAGLGLLGWAGRRRRRG